jgi:hypothetical protein
MSVSLGARKLDKLCRASVLSMEFVADEAGFTQGSIQRFINGNRVPNLRARGRLEFATRMEACRMYTDGVDVTDGTRFYWQDIDPVQATVRIEDWDCP